MARALSEVSPALLERAERDTVDLPDSEHLREYARQLRGRVAEMSAMTLRGILHRTDETQDIAAESQLSDDGSLAFREINNLSDMIYSMVRNG